MQGATSGSRPFETYVIAEPCVGRKDTACLDVCPVDAIHPNRDDPQFLLADQLHINSQACIGCGSCFRACAAKAVFSIDSLPDSWYHFRDANASYFAADLA